jgi:hypothetical protein
LLSTVIAWKNNNPASLSDGAYVKNPTNCQDKEYYLHLQHISPPHVLWILYKAIEGDLAAAQYTRTEIREYISALQSTTNLAHPEPQPSAYPLQENPA